jgi:hypothetical protein
MIYGLKSIENVNAFNFAGAIGLTWVRYFVRVSTGVANTCDVLKGYKLQLITSQPQTFLNYTPSVEICPDFPVFATFEYRTKSNLFLTTQLSVDVIDQIPQLQQPISIIIS